MGIVGTALTNDISWKHIQFRADSSARRVLERERWHTPQQSTPSYTAIRVTAMLSRTGPMGEARKENICLAGASEVSTCDVTVAGSVALHKNFRSLQSAQDKMPYAIY